MERPDCKDLVGHGRSLGFYFVLGQEGIPGDFNEKVKHLDSEARLHLAGGYRANRGSWDK